MTNEQEYKNFDVALKAELVETFKVVIEFFNEHNLKWWVCGGTMLGAIRHNNIIPWDDDIDLMMPREDFNKLLTLKSQLAKPYELKSPHDEGYFKCTTKICNTSTTLWERQRDPSSMGVFIDIFPLDSFDLTFEQYCEQHVLFKKKMRQFELSKSRYSLSEMLSNIRENRKGALLDGVLSLFYPFAKSENYRNSFLAVEQMFNQGSGKYTASPTGAYGTREFYESEWFEDTIQVDFADFKVNVPKGYDSYLKVMYGDYMQLPPEEKRVTHHGQYYVNLKENLSKDKLQIDIKNGKHLVF